MMTMLFPPNGLSIWWSGCATVNRTTPDLEGPAYSAFPDGIGGQAPGLQKAAQIQVVVVADTDVLMRPSSRLTPHSNSLFILNTLDNLAAPQALADIRPRPPTQYTLHSLENQRKATARASMLWPMPTGPSFSAVLAFTFT